MRRLVVTGALVGAVAAGGISAGTAGPLAAQESGLIAVGEMAPDFALPGATRYGQLEGPIRLADYRGRKLVLYFYPMDDTPLCTAQACSYRDEHPG